MEFKNILLGSAILIIFNLFLIYILRFIAISGNFLIDKTNKVQSVSIKKNVTCIGGIIIFINLLIFAMQEKEINSRIFLFFLFFILIIGILSDLKEKFLAKSKIILIYFICVIFLFYNKNYLIKDLGIDYLNNYYLNNIVLQILFTSFCISLCISGINMIDGINGNTIIYCLIVITNLIILDNHKLSTLSSVMIIALSLLLLFNLKNKIFLGDNGSYLLGAIISLLTIDSINKNQEAHPFLACYILLYPCLEVLISIIRKKNYFKADKLHLHIKLHSRFGNNAIIILIIINSFFIFQSSFIKNEKYLITLYISLYIVIILLFNKYANQNFNNWWRRVRW
jgi:UDP-GlcNAc:undecaprenyl-phosphate GlcNAc-1-phosphate transferase